ncbi:MAG: hypothetical protein GY772_29705, partial [bacterium]|nr:hypothetical protein [bacterium]
MHALIVAKPQKCVDILRDILEAFAASAARGRLALALVVFALAFALAFRSPRAIPRLQTSRLGAGDGERELGMEESKLHGLVKARPWHK